MRRLNLACVAFAAALSLVAAEIFTSMADMELLLNVEEQVPSVIDKYIEAEQGRLQRLRESVKASNHIESD